MLFVSCCYILLSKAGLLPTRLSVSKPPIPRQKGCDDALRGSSRLFEQLFELFSVVVVCFLRSSSSSFELKSSLLQQFWWDPQSAMSCPHCSFFLCPIWSVCLASLHACLRPHMMIIITTIIITTLTLTLTSTSTNISVINVIDVASVLFFYGLAPALHSLVVNCPVAAGVRRDLRSEIIIVND